MASMVQDLRLWFEKYTSSIGPDFEDVAWHALLCACAVLVFYVCVFQLHELLLRLQDMCKGEDKCRKSTKYILKITFYIVAVVSGPVTLLMMLASVLLQCAAVLVEVFAAFMGRAMDEPLYGITRLAVVVVVLIVTPEGILDVLKNVVTAPQYVLATLRPLAKSAS